MQLDLVHPAPPSPQLVCPLVTPTRAPGPSRSEAERTRRLAVLIRR
jgi:hypothetical protein